MKEEEKKQATFQSEATQRTEEEGGAVCRSLPTAAAAAVRPFYDGRTDGRIVPLSSLSTFSHKDDRSRIKCHVLRFHLKDVLRHIARGKDFNC